VTKKPVHKPKAKTHEDEEREWFRANLWKRIDEIKHRPRFRPPEDWELKIIAGEIPTHTVPISTTGVDSSYHYRLVERQRDFERTIFYIRSAFDYAMTNNTTLSDDQIEHFKRVWDAFQSNVWRSGTDDLIEAMIATAFELGTFCGRHPVNEKARTGKGRGTISANIQRRREALTPLVLEEAKINRKSIPKRAWGPANKLLKAKGLVKKDKKGISLRTFAEVVSQILAENPE
jgi:hypothetical protein